MLKATISFTEIKKKILMFGILNSVIFIILFLLRKHFNLLHLSGLRMFNYAPLFFISLFQIKNWTKHLGRYIPSLQAFGIIFFTGSLSFLFFAAFMFIYSLYDSHIIELYFNTSEKLGSMYSFVIFLEGIAGSILVGLIAMMYSDRYKDGEAKFNN